MKYRKGVFVVVYKKQGNKILYLVLHRKLHWKGWEFLKGGLKRHENILKAVRRELKEEAGCKPLKIVRYHEHGEYKYNRKFADRKGIAGQTYNLFSAEVDCKKIRLDKKEHDGYKWLEFKEALKILTWPNQKRCLRIVNKKVKID